MVMALYKFAGNSGLTGALRNDMVGFATIGSTKLGVGDGGVDRSRFGLRRGWWFSDAAMVKLFNTGKDSVGVLGGRDGESGGGGASGEGIGGRKVKVFVAHVRPLVGDGDGGGREAHVGEVVLKVANRVGDPPREC